jgi:hypothetical protein
MAAYIPYLGFSPDFFFDPPEPKPVFDRTFRRAKAAVQPSRPQVLLRERAGAIAIGTGLRQPQYLQARTFLIARLRLSPVPHLILPPTIPGSRIIGRRTGEARLALADAADLIDNWHRPSCRTAAEVRRGSGPRPALCLRWCVGRPGRRRAFPGRPGAASGQQERNRRQTQGNRHDGSDGGERAAFAWALKRGAVNVNPFLWPPKQQLRQ